MAVAATSEEKIEQLRSCLPEMLAEQISLEQRLGSWILLLIFLLKIRHAARSHLCLLYQINAENNEV